MGRGRLDDLFGHFLDPSVVIRITGGSAYTEVAIMPTSGPMPQSIMTGIR